MRRGPKCRDARQKDELKIGFIVQKQKRQAMLADKESKPKTNSKRTRKNKLPKNGHGEKQALGTRGQNMEQEIMNRPKK